MATRTVEVDAQQIRNGVATLFPLLIVGMTAIYATLDSAYTVKPHEKAVVFRLGRILATEEAGLHFKIPFADEVVLVDTRERQQRLPFDVAPQSNQRDGSNEDETLMLTGDLNAAVVEWTIQWTVVDPARFLTAIDENAVEQLIRNVARTVMHQVIGDYSIDEVLTAKRTQVGTEARELLQQVLDSYESGISITGLQMQRVTPPYMVKPAFDEVNASVQRRDQLINEANRERNVLIPKAEAEKDRLIREAEGYAARRRAETEGEISAIREQYKAYKENPEVTRQRMYLEAMEQIYTTSGPKVVVDDSLKGVLPLLNLDSQSLAPPAPEPEMEQEN
jgi:membrane protease subunit HflK